MVNEGPNCARKLAWTSSDTGDIFCFLLRRSLNVFAMNSFVVLVVFVITSTSAQEEGVTTVRKCCANGFQLSESMDSCVNMPGMNTSLVQNDLYSPQINTSIPSWIPKRLQNTSFVVLYNVLPNIKMDVMTVRVLNNSHTEMLVNLNGDINDTFIRDKQDCYDITQGTHGSQVLLTSYKLAAINKCCGKGQKWNMRINGCEPLAGFTGATIQEEVVGVPRKTELFRWLPDNTLNSVVKVNYNFLKGEFTLDSPLFLDDNFQWQMSQTEPFGNTVLTFRGTNVSGAEILGTTDIFCFDEAGDTPTHPRVLLSAVYVATKCCKQGEQIKSVTPWDLAIRKPPGGQMNACIPKSVQMVRNISNKVVDWRNNLDTEFWLPNSLRHRTIHVRYDVFKNMSFNEDTLIFFDESKWALQNDVTSLPKLLLNFTDFFGRRLHLASSYFCFDYLEELGRVVVAHIPKPKYSITKCCLSGERLSPSGTCEPHDGEDWSAFVSPFYTYI